MAASEFKVLTVNLMNWTVYHLINSLYDNLDWKDQYQATIYLVSVVTPVSKDPIYDFLEPVWSLNVILNIFFIYKNKLYKDNETEIDKKIKNKLRTIPGWELQKQRTKIAMIYLSSESLHTKEGPELQPSNLLSCNQMFHRSYNLILIKKELWMPGVIFAVHR